MIMNYSKNDEATCQQVFIHIMLPGAQSLQKKFLMFDTSELPAKYFLLLPLLWNLLLNIFALLTLLWNLWILLKTINHVGTNSISDRSHQSWSVPNIVSAVWSWTHTSLIVQLFTPPHHHLPSLTKILFFSLSYVDNQQLWLGNWGWFLLITIPISNSVSGQKMQ